MIIDSHAHYTSKSYSQNFRYLSRNEEGYALSEGDLDQLFQDLLNAQRILEETDSIDGRIHRFMLVARKKERNHD